MFKYVIFDVDGTMIDTEEAVIYAYQSVIHKKHGRHFSEEELLKGYGVPTPQSLANYGFTNIEEATKDYYTYLMLGFARCTAFDGVIDVLSQLIKKKLPIGIVTSRSRYEMKIDACLQSIINKFDAVVSSDDTTLHKPNGEPLLKAIEKLNADPTETIYVGDTIFDSECAGNAGVKFALALWGSKNANAIKADYYLKKPSDLLELL